MLMLIRMVVLTHVIPQLAGTCSWLRLLFLENVKNKIKFQNQLKLNSVSCLQIVQKSYRWSDFSKNWVSKFLPLLVSSTQASPSWVQSNTKVNCHFIWEKIQDNLISLPHISLSHQIADIFTKGMTQDRHQFLISKLMLADLHQFEGGSVKEHRT